MTRPFYFIQNSRKALVRGVTCTDAPKNRLAPTKTITDTQTLSDFCTSASNCRHRGHRILKERTYYSKLCLIQLALPGKTNDNVVLVDPAQDLSLKPLYDLFRNKNVVKVFHAARQDLEIFCLKRM